MSITINTTVAPSIIALAHAIEDLSAAKNHSIPSDAAKARHALARYIRDKHAEVQRLLSLTAELALDAETSVMSLTSQVINQLRAERSNLKRVARERLERLEAERAEMALLFGIGIAA